MGNKTHPSPKEGEHYPYKGKWTQYVRTKTPNVRLTSSFPPPSWMKISRVLSTVEAIDKEKIKDKWVLLKVRRGARRSWRSLVLVCGVREANFTHSVSLLYKESREWVHLTKSHKFSSLPLVLTTRHGLKTQFTKVRRPFSSDTYRGGSELLWRGVS